MNRRIFVSLLASLPMIPAGMMFASPRILVLGDSVTWGQGLLPSEKMHSLLASMLFARNGVEPDVLHYAHSGATIGFAGETPTPLVAVPGWWPREIPRANPTLYEQCLQVATDHPDQRFDVVILTGGINDVGVRTIFNPATTAEQIQRLSAQYCRAAMESLLAEMHARFVVANPSVKIIVLGYYSVLSGKSKIPSIYKVLEVLAQETINPPKPKPGLVAYNSELAALSLQQRLIANSVAFRDASALDLSAAVTAANANFQANNFLFIDPTITDDEAAFTATPLIWGLNENEKPQDPVYNDRLAYCRNLLREKPGIDRFTCDRASLGHPNIHGAQRYAAVLFSALTGQQAQPLMPSAPKSTPSSAPFFMSA